VAEVNVGRVDNVLGLARFLIPKYFAHGIDGLDDGQGRPFTASRLTEMETSDFFYVFSNAHELCDHKLRSLSCLPRNRCFLSVRKY
jgi:hypothetical protein